MSDKSVKKSPVRRPVKVADKHYLRKEDSKQLAVYLVGDEYRSRAELGNPNLVKVKGSRVRDGEPSNSKKEVATKSPSKKRVAITEKPGYEKAGKNGAWVKLCKEGLTRGPNGRCQKSEDAKKASRSLKSKSAVVRRCAESGGDYNPYNGRCVKPCADGKRRSPANYKCYDKCDPKSDKPIRSPSSNRCVSRETYAKQHASFKHPREIRELAEKLGISLVLPRKPKTSSKSS